MIEVWWKRQGEWIRTETCPTLDAALEYANMNISHGHITERIELREQSGEVIRTVFDWRW